MCWLCGVTHCLSGSLILGFKLPGKVSCHIPVLRKCSAKSSALSKELDLIDFVKRVEFNSNINGT